jgi:hypothetical protein
LIGVRLNDADFESFKAMATESGLSYSSLAKWMFNDALRALSEGRRETWRDRQRVREILNDTAPATNLVKVYISGDSFKRFSAFAAEIDRGYSDVGKIIIRQYMKPWRDNLLKERKARRLAAAGYEIEEESDA